MAKLVKVNQFNQSGTVHYRVQQSENGESTVLLSVDYERVPEPENSYVADYFEVHETEADVLMIFGKTDFPNADLRNMLEIYFPFHAFVHQLWKSSRQLQKNLEETFEKKGKVAKQPGNLTKPVSRVQTLAANNAVIVNSGGQCVIDFLLLAAKDVWLKTKSGDPLNVAAIVRIFVSEQLVLGFLKSCDDIAQRVKDKIDVPVQEEHDENLESIEL